MRLVVLIKQEILSSLFGPRLDIPILLYLTSFERQYTLPSSEQILLCVFAFWGRFILQHNGSYAHPFITLDLVRFETHLALSNYSIENMMQFLQEDKSTWAALPKEHLMLF